MDVFASNNSTEDSGTENIIIGQEINTNILQIK